MHTYTLSHEDLLTILIYDLSTDEKKVTRRKRTVWILFGSFLLLSIICCFIGDFWVSIMLIIVALLSLLFGDVYLKYVYKIAITKAVKNDLTNMVGSPIQFNIASNSIHVTDKVGDSNFLFSQILMVNEIAHYFVFKFSNGLVLGVPKISDNLKIDVKKMISEHNLPYYVHLDWKWQNTLSYNITSDHFYINQRLNPNQTGNSSRNAQSDPLNRKTPSS